MARRPGRQGAASRSSAGSRATDGEGRLLGRDPRRRPPPAARLGDRAPRPCWSRWRSRRCSCTPSHPASTLCRSRSRRSSRYNKIQDAFPGGATPAIVAIKGDASDPTLQAAVADLKAQALASGKALEPIYVGRRTGRQRRSAVAIPLVGNGTDAVVERRRSRRCATSSCRRPSARSPASTYAVTGDTAAVEGLERRDEVARRRSCSSSCSRFAFLLLLVTFRSIVIPIKAILHEPALGRAPRTACWSPSSSGAGARTARLPAERRDRLVAADVPVRDPVRALDGLPRVHPEPGPRVLRPRHEHRGRRRAGSARPQVSSPAPRS